MKKAYVGIPNDSGVSVARKLEKAYIGVPTEVPTYEGEIVTTNITADNIAEFFTVTNGTYYFEGDGATFTSNNNGVHDSSATTVLTAKVDIGNISFDYSISSESGWDKFTVVVADTVVADAISGTNSDSWEGSLTAGEMIELTYTKDSGLSAGSDIATISNIVFVEDNRVQTGTEVVGVAHKIIKAYVGVDGVARLWWDDSLELIDFEYIENDDSTYTLTAWKGTLNGVESTELVIPDDERIIL